LDEDLALFYMDLYHHTPSLSSSRHRPSRFVLRLLSPSLLCRFSVRQHLYDHIVFDVPLPSAFIPAEQ
jgi:hypothetical protein